MHKYGKKEIIYEGLHKNCKKIVSKYYLEVFSTFAKRIILNSFLNIFVRLMNILIII